MKYLRWILLCVLPCIGAIAQPAGWPLEDAPINLFVGDSRVLDVATTRIAVGNGKVLSAAPVSAQQIVLIGQAPGSTVLQLWLRDGSQRRIEVIVTASDLQATLRAVQGMLQGIEGVEARLAGQRILLEGDSADARARERAAAIAGLFPGVVVDFVGKLGWENMVHVDVRIVEFRRGRLRELGIKPALACWSIPFVRSACALIDMGLIDDPPYFFFVCGEGGTLGAHPATPEGLRAFTDHLPRRRNLVWSVGCKGGNLFPLAMAAIAAGGHVAIGIGDYPYPELGQPSNARLVDEVVRLARLVGREVASPAEARTLLGISADSTSRE